MKRHLGTGLLGGIAVVLLASAPALATTLKVPGDYPTIAAALAAAENSDIITVEAGTYPTRVIVGKSVTLQGAGAGQTVLDGGGTGRVLIIDPGSSVSVHGVTITNGRAPEDFGYGGGVFNNGILRLERCLVTGNAAPTAGGGVSNYDGILTLADSTISGNSAAIGGGVDNEGLLTAFGCTLSGNTAPILGGGLATMDTAALVNCTVAGNTSARGGGVYCGSGTFSLDSVTISDNTAPSGGGMSTFGSVRPISSLIAGNHGARGADIDGRVASLGYNLIGDATDALGMIASDMCGTAAVPLDAALGQLQDNGGPTATMMPGPGSPAIDAGPAKGFAALDQRGVVRPLDGDADGTVVADIGACEATATAYSISELAVCLRTAAGIHAATPVTARRLNAARQGSSANQIDVADATQICRKIAGTSPNP